MHGASLLWRMWMPVKCSSRQTSILAPFRILVRDRILVQAVRVASAVDPADLTAARAARQVPLVRVPADHLINRLPNKVLCCLTSCK
jgi:hypothetical protein